MPGVAIKGVLCFRSDWSGEICMIVVEVAVKYEYRSLWKTRANVHETGRELVPCGEIRMNGVGVSVYACSLYELQVVVGMVVLIVKWPRN